jgi:hypothetical protein
MVTTRINGRKSAGRPNHHFASNHQFMALRLSSHLIFPRTLSRRLPPSTAIRNMATSHVKDSPLSVEVNKKAHEFDKNQFDSLMVSRFFYAPAFEIYGGE